MICDTVYGDALTWRSAPFAYSLRSPMQLSCFIFIVIKSSLLKRGPVTVQRPLWNSGVLCVTRGKHALTPLLVLPPLCRCYRCWRYGRGSLLCPLFSLLCPFFQTDDIIRELCGRVAFYANRSACVHLCVRGASKTVGVHRPQSGPMQFLILDLLNVLNNIFYNLNGRCINWTWLGSELTYYFIDIIEIHWKIYQTPIVGLFQNT